MTQTIAVQKCPLMRKSLYFTAQVLAANGRGEFVSGLQDATLRLLKRASKNAPANQLVESKTTGADGTCRFAAKINHQEMALYAVEANPPAAGGPVPAYWFAGAGTQAFQPGPTFDKTGKAFFYKVTFKLAVLRLGPPLVFETVPLGTAAAPLELDIYNDDVAPMTVTSVQIRGGGGTFAITRALAVNTIIQPGGRARVQITATPAQAAAVQAGFVDVQTQGHGAASVGLEASAYAISAFAATRSPFAPGTEDAAFAYTVVDPKGAAAAAKVEILLRAKVVHTIVAPHAAGAQVCAWRGAIADPETHPGGFTLLRHSPYTARVTLSKAGGARPHALTCQVQVSPAVGELRVTVERHDGAALHGRADFVITGTVPVVAAINRQTVAAGNPNREELLLQGLAVGEYTVQLQNAHANAGGYLHGAALARIAPDQTGLVKVRVAAGQRAEAKLVLSSYTHLQFIGWHATPTGQNRPGGAISTYRGHVDDRHDMLARVALLKQAMQDAQAHGQIAGAHALKLFMVPEFYFRGWNGGYPIEVIEEILPKLFEEAQQLQYADWLFVYGTAIGFHKHDTGGAVSAYELIISHYTPEDAVLFTPPSARLVRNPAHLTSAASVCKRIAGGRAPPAAWVLREVGAANQAQVWNATRISDDEYELQLLLGSTALALGPAQLVEPEATEIFNVTLVQRGGPAPGGARDRLIFKEWISSIDFLGAHHPRAAGDFGGGGAATHKADVHGTEHRLLIPTEGSRDMLTTSTNLPAAGGISEENKSGVGGGGLFQMGGVNIGVEICLDHLSARLMKYAPHATPGDSVPQVLLIPSWGMNIALGPSYVVPNGLLFNVDGRNGPAYVPQAGTLTGHRCPDHPHAGAVVPAALPVPVNCPQQHFTCAGHRLAHYQNAGPCQRCNQAMIPFSNCTHHLSTAANCAWCGAGGLARTHTRCINHGVRLGAVCGLCPVVGLPLYQCGGNHRFNGVACTCGSLNAAAPTGLVVCTRHAQTEYAIGFCRFCNAALQPETRPLKTTVFVPLAVPTVVAVPDPGVGLPVNDQTVTTEVKTRNSVTGATTELSSVAPAGAAPIELPSAAPTTDAKVRDAVANSTTRTRTRTWDTMAAGALVLRLTCTVAVTTQVAGNVTTVSQVTTTARAGTIQAGYAQLIAVQSQLHIFAAAALPNAAVV